MLTAFAFHALFAYFRTYLSHLPDQAHFTLSHLYPFRSASFGDVTRRFKIHTLHTKHRGTVTLIYTQYASNLEDIPKLNSLDTGPDKSPLKMSLSEKAPKPDLHDSKSSSFSIAHNVDHQHEETFPRDATDAEILNLPHIRGEITMATWVLIFACASTNFARYGITAIFRESSSLNPE